MSSSSNSNMNTSIPPTRSPSSSIPQTKVPDDKDNLIGTQQIALSLFAVAASMMAGVYTTVRREKLAMKNIVGAGTPAIVASKALLYGSAYSIGGFFLGTSAIVMFTGVTSFKEFGEYIDVNFRTEEGYRRVLEKRERERKQLEALSVKYAHLSKYDLLWKQLRSNEELENDEDEEDEKIIASSSPEERERLLAERDHVTNGNKNKTKRKENSSIASEDPEHYNVVLVALTNLKKITSNIGARLFNLPMNDVVEVKESTNVDSENVDNVPTLLKKAPQQKQNYEDDSDKNLLVRKWNKLVNIWTSDDTKESSAGDVNYEEKK